MKANHCGRVHLGPVCVNGGDKGQPICEACGRPVTRAEREMVQRMWNQVHSLLAKHKGKKEKR
jgi:hypothetical protein